MTIYLLRHGETIWNRDRRLQGQRDTPLTLRGAHQAVAMGRALARVLGGRRPGAMLSSPLGRAYQTAALVADEIGVDPDRIVLEHRVIETSFGAWDGLNMEEILERYPHEWAERRADRWHRAPPGGESHAEVAERAGRFLAAMPDQRPLVIVAHGSFNRILRGLWRGLDGLASLALDEPQDGFYRLDPERRECFIPAGAVPREGAGSS